MGAMKEVYTTGEAARICKVSQQTIIRCFDSGQLRGFRVPGSRFRRIPREELIRFMREHNIPMDALEEDGRIKVLIVDDDVDLVEVITEAFERDGRFLVRSATTGFEAGMLVRDFQPDVVVLDVMLPDINGKEVCRRLRRDEKLRSVKIICISGMVERRKVGELKRAGANDFLAKPFDIEELIARVCKLVDLELPAGMKGRGGGRKRRARRQKATSA